MVDGEKHGGGHHLQKSQAEVELTFENVRIVCVWCNCAPALCSDCEQKEALLAWSRYTVQLDARMRSWELRWPVVVSGCELVDEPELEISC